MTSFFYCNHPRLRNIKRLVMAAFDFHLLNDLTEGIVMLVRFYKG